MKPNILFVFSDQHRKFDLGCYGHEKVLTPNLDSLANRGLRFNHCVSNSPLCVPARGTILTGLFASKHKAFTNDISIDCKCESIASVMKNAGYYTGYIGKWHLNGIPRDQAIPSEKRLGFEYWKVHNCNHNYLDFHYYDEENVKHKIDGYEPVICTDLAMGFIENAQKPWVLYLSYATPHDPHSKITDDYMKPYKDSDIKLRPNVKENVRIFGEKYKGKEEYRESVKGYYGHISAIDEQIGRVLDLLEEKNQLDNTLVIYTSDHGDMLGSHGEIDKQVPFEESIAIPLIVFWKGKVRVGVSDELIGLNDLPVSIAALVGARFNSKTDGEDLSKVFLDETEKSYDSAYLYEYFPAHNYGSKGGKAWRGIRTKRYTYAVQSDNENWLLFDNESDPYQERNLAGKDEFCDLQKSLWDELNMHIKKNDELLDGVSYVEKFGNVKEFNESQRYFKKDVLAKE